MQLAVRTRGREDGPERSCCSPAPNMHGEAFREKLPIVTQGFWAPFPKETVVAVSPPVHSVMHSGHLISPSRSLAA